MKFNFERLKIWEKAHKLTLEIYRITRDFPKYELYGITSQLRRAIASVSANIVEGYSRKGKKEFIQFLYQARGSLDESIYLIILSKDLGYFTVNGAEKLLKDASDLMKMLNSFISYLKNKKA